MHSLQHLVRKLVSKESALQAKAQEAQSQVARIHSELAEADRLLARKDEMVRALEMLQLRAQAKNKGIYEETLTALIREVMPGKGDEIVLTSSMKNNRASLDIDVMIDGELENVSEDKGGSISNIIAMGLRFIVLARHPNRRVLLLDEADCHLKSKYIPAFAAVMQQLAHRMGIQVIYISHHPSNLFTGYGRVHELISDGGKVHCRIADEEPVAPEDYEAPDSALRYVRLKQFCQHANTLIELGPGLNVITGENDLGKTKIIQAIVELTENNGKERRIQRKKNFFEVEIGIEEGMSLFWRYQRNGAKKTLMELRSPDGAVIESSDSGNAVPEWLHTYLAMPPVNGENIHFHSQKKPGFILEGCSATDRAQMLPLGRESRDVLAMIQLFNARLNEARQKRRRLEIELNQQQNLLACMSLIIEHPVDTSTYHETYDAYQNKAESNSRKAAIVNKLERVSTLKSLYDEGLQMLERQVIPKLELTALPAMVNSARNLKRIEAQRKSLESIRLIQAMKPTPILSNLRGIGAAGAKIKKLTDAVELIKSVTNLQEIKAPTLKDASKLGDRIVRLDQQREKMSLTVLDLKNTQKDIATIENQKNKLIEELGGICPTCEKPMEQHTHV